MEAPPACRLPEGLSVSPLFSDGALVAVVAGEADWVTASQLQDELVGLLGHGPQAMIVDVTGLNFCSLRGLDALSTAIAVLQEAGMEVTMRGMSPVFTWLSTFATAGAAPSRSAGRAPRGGGDQQR